MTGPVTHWPRWMALAVALCAVAALPFVWEASQSWIFPDGLSYLDMASGALHSPSILLKNAYWSPAYPVALAIMLAVVRPAPAGEIQAVYALHWMLFVLAAGGLAWLLRTLMQTLRQTAWRELDISDSLAKSLIGFTFALFLVANLNPTLWYMTPDMLVQALVYLAASFALKLYLPGASWRHAVGLGVILGLGYLAKAAVFPVALILIAILFFKSPDWPARRNSLIAAACFCVVSAPLVMSLSLEKHRFTFGDSGKLNYAWFVAGVPAYSGWRGQPPENGTPVHPHHIVSEAPLILEFRGPVPGTLPIWYDPTYWWDGLKTPISLGRQIRGVLQAFWEPHSMQSLFLAFAAVLASLSLLNSRIRGAVRSSGMPAWILLAWPASACLMYSMVLFNLRYVVAYVVMLGVGSATLFLQPLGSAARVRVLTALTILLVLVFGLRVRPIAARALRAEDAGGLLTRQPGQDNDASSAAVADALYRMGIRPGDEISQLGHSMDCYYARRAGVRVVAQIWENPSDYVNLGAPQVQQVLEKLKQLGVKALVSRGAAGFANDQGWQHVPRTEIYIRPL